MVCCSGLKGIGEGIMNDWGSDALAAGSYTLFATL